LLLEEDFRIKILALEQGFDPDLYIRRKGKAEYGRALGRSNGTSIISSSVRQRSFPFVALRQKQSGKLSYASRSARARLGCARRVANEIIQKLEINSKLLEQD